MEEKKWYSQGLRFECIGCGRCCSDHDGYAYVYLMNSDIEAITGYLEMTKADFMDQYCDEKDDLVFLKMNGPDCPFLEESKCKIYPVRPIQCDTWPFWQENLDEGNWESEVLNFCPGAGKGKLYSVEIMERLAAKCEEAFCCPVEET